jgi:peptidoglycan/xylan/chitin deacetylase (PgdA/CDA1 family)
MANPFHTLGYRILNASMQGTSAQSGKLAKLSRRGFMLMGISLSSCSAAAFSNSQAANLFKTGANSKYRTPSLQGPVPRNPDMSLSSNFARNAGISFSRVMVSGNYIAMTFDDGPHPQNTPRLLDILRARNIKATFYVIGQSVDLYPQVVRRTVAEGHEIGNHSYSHRLLSKSSDSEIQFELSRCREAVVRAAGVQPRTMRPPYGGLLQRQREMIYSQFGYPTILWSVDPLDWKRPGSSAVTSRILQATTAGSIILSHDLHAGTVDAMPATLDGLLRRGFRFVTVSQLLAMKTEAITAQTALTPENS